MRDHRGSAPTAEADLQLPLGVRFASLEPMAPRRATGDIVESLILGRMAFTSMPEGVCSFWRGIKDVPGSPFPLEVVCDVVGDRAPGAGHEARLAGMRLCQVTETLAALGLINRRLSDLQVPKVVGIRELVVTGVRLPARPLIDPRSERTYRSASLAEISVTVVFALGVPASARICGAPASQRNCGLKDC